MAVRLTDEVFEALARDRDAGQILEITAVVALFNYFNRFANALRIPPTRAGRLPDHCREMSSMPLALRMLAAAGAVLIVAGCDDSIEPLPEYDYGFLSVTATRRGDGSIVAEPLAIFYHSTQLILPTSQVSRDSCAIRPTATSTAGVVDHISPGDSVSVQLGGGTVYLKPRLNGQLTVFLLPPDSVLGFTPGEQVTFTIPGDTGGFPQTAASTLAPEPFTPGDIPTTPPVGSPITVTWTPAGSTQSRMLLFLQYAGLGSTSLDQMVFCSLQDDGSHTIPASLLGGWRAAFHDLRAVRAIRERITFTDLDHAKLHVTSSFRVDVANP